MTSAVQPYRGTLYSNHSLSRYTSWHIGGTARAFYKPIDLDDCLCFLSTLPASERVIFLGLGSNVLFPDEQLDATVISTRHALTQLTWLDDATLRAEAGVTCSKLAKYATSKGAAKAAFFAGIPGTVGGALAMNAGAFGGETWQYVSHVECITRTGEQHIYGINDFKVSYREVLGPDVFFSAGVFKFELTSDLDAHSSIKQLLKQRNATQPIGTFNCGSVFRNPAGDYAARLIEAAQLKGVRVGDAQVSEHHANFILNQGQATARDIRTLIEYIQNKVHSCFGIQLVPEVQIIE
ncbi:MAG: UDP-N-acetylenolpyruvoylglucosamine reductase [Legionellales bacterium]|nr:UDP-N-acetylenolpyruvoylglucosamine reductase [Legionellales bacterium]